MLAAVDHEQMSKKSLTGVYHANGFFHDLSQDCVLYNIFQRLSNFNHEYFFDKSEGGVGEDRKVIDTSKVSVTTELFILLFFIMNVKLCRCRRCNDLFIITLRKYV